MAASSRRATLLQEWMVFFERHPVLLMPISWRPPFPIDGDQQGRARVSAEFAAFSPMLATAILALPARPCPPALPAERRWGCNW